MERLLEGRWFHVILMAVIAASVIAVYSNTFHSAFQFDDTPSIAQNPRIKDLGNLSGILKSRRGVTELTFALNYAAGGLDTFGYHAVNAAIHVLASIAAYFLVAGALRLSGGTAAWSRFVAAFSALLFAVHPVQTQAVTYISQRMESLSSLFYLLALLVFIKAVEAKSVAARYGLYACVAAAYAAGFYSKEIVFTLPAAILLFDIYFVSRGRIKEALGRWPLYAALFALFIFFGVKTVAPLSGFGDLSIESAETSAPARPRAAPGGAAIAAASHIAGAVDNARPVAQRPGAFESAGFNVADITPKEYLYTQFNVLVYYLVLLAVPVNQNLDYDFPVARSLFGAPRVNEGAALNMPMMPPAVSLAMLLAAGGAGVWLFVRSRRRPGPRGLAVSFFIFWFFIILSPTSSFIPIVDVIFEHRVYLASLGFFVILVIFIDWITCLAFGAGAKNP
ncbi:MAG: hypothetical protein HY894_00565 [Deltaproteobacteria bacterium]|nr:hypothetical protein [Deltaproteobacteria bacterium]